MIRSVSVKEAAQAFKACEVDCAAEVLASRSEARFHLDVPGQGSMVYGLSFHDGIAWINAATGQGQGMTEIGLHVIEHQARAVGCRVVGFATVRPGLVRRARRCGYVIDGQAGRGWNLSKVIQ